MKTILRCRGKYEAITDVTATCRFTPLQLQLHSPKHCTIAATAAQCHRTGTPPPTPHTHQLLTDTHTPPAPSFMNMWWLDDVVNGWGRWGGAEKDWGYNKLPSWRWCCGPVALWQSIEASLHKHWPRDRPPEGSQEMTWQECAKRSPKSLVAQFYTWSWAQKPKWQA